MTDVLTSEQRRRCMSRIGPKGSVPEMTVRSIVHRLGYRFRLHRADLPGKPDLVLPRHRAVIFVHGCFWHRHSCKYGRPQPKTNADFWRDKLQRNVERDKRVKRQLLHQGWRVLVVWECETRSELRASAKIKRFLSSTGTPDLGP